MISFKEFQGFDLRIGEVVSVDNFAIRVNVGEEVLVKADLDVTQGDKVVVLINGEKPAILSIGRESVCVDGDIDAGTKIS